MRKIILLSMFAVVLLSSCKKEVIRGGGSSSTRTISLPPFNAIESHYDISAEVTYDTQQVVTVTGYDNLLDILDLEVENGVLKLKYNSDDYSIRNGNVVARISIPVLNRVTIHGSQNIAVSGFNSGASLNAALHGSGNIQVNSSNYQSADLEIHGSGNIDAQGLRVNQLDASIHGSGDISISVVDRIVASIYGSGDIYYWGDPVVNAGQHGSGRVIKR